jgi:predicted AlkP superfamily pyrophosphatase or phosphodiesterase
MILPFMQRTNRWFLPVSAMSLNGADSHVIVVGLDGGSPDGIRTSRDATFHRLMRNGAQTLRARGAMPTASSPGVSMIMSAGPEQHGVNSNDWQPGEFDFEIPWFLSGPGVRRGHEIRAAVNTYDTAATVVHILKLIAPQAWIGRPVREAFEK